MLVVHGLTDFHGSISGVVNCIFYMFDVIQFEVLVFPLSQVSQSLFNILNFLSRKFASELVQLFLSGFMDIEGFVLQVDELSSPSVLLLELFGLFDHSLDFFFGEAARTLDRHLLFFACGLVPGTHVHNAVGVDVKGDLNLGNSSRSWRNA